MGPFTESTIECERAPTGAVSRLSNPSHLDTVLFAALLLLSIAPIWWFRYFPSQDGPVHLENASGACFRPRLPQAADGRRDRELRVGLCANASHLTFVWPPTFTR